MNPPYETYVTIVFILQIRKLRVRRVSSLPKVTELGKGRVWTGTLSGLANASKWPPLNDHPLPQWFSVWYLDQLLQHHLGTC